MVFDDQAIYPNIPFIVSPTFLHSPEISAPVGGSPGALAGAQKGRGSGEDACKKANKQREQRLRNRVHSTNTQ